MTRVLEQLSVGSRVFYPAHGVVVVTGIEERELGAGVQAFYVLELEREPGTRLLLPTGNVRQAGVRALVSAAKARELLRTVHEEAAAPELRSDPAGRKLRATHYAEALRSGSADRYTEMLRELLWRSRAGKLPASEQQTLDAALALFVGEVSAALGMSSEELRADLRAISERPAVGA